MTKKNIILIGLGLFAVLFYFMSSYSVDLLPDSLAGDENASESEAKGKAILANAWKAHGVDSFNTHKVYQMIAVDTWQGPMAGIGKLWPQKISKLAFKYAPNTFDAQVKFLDGKKEGFVAGLQAWKYYEKPVDGEISFDVADNERFRFGMAAYQYFTEMVGRLSHAEIVRYAGEKEFNGKQYDLVFATWGSLEGNDQSDQYLLYINKESDILEYVTYTIRDNYLKMPGAGMFYGSMGFSDFHDIDGFKVPFTQSAFMNGPSKDNGDNLHQLKLESFSFDGFELSELYPEASIKRIGDKKG